MGLQPASSTGHDFNNLVQTAQALASHIRDNRLQDFEELSSQYSSKQLQEIATAHPLLHTAARVGGLGFMQKVASWHSPHALSQALVEPVVGQTLLYRVAALGQEDLLSCVVGLLVNESKSVQEANLCRNHFGKTPLHELVVEKRWPVLSKVIAIIRPILTESLLDEFVKGSGDDPSLLGRVLSYGKMDNILTAQQLLGAQRLQRAFHHSRQGIPLIYDAVTSGNLEVVKWAQDQLQMAHLQERVLIPVTLPGRSSILRHAVKSGDIETLSYILSLVHEEDRDRLIPNDMEAYHLLLAAAGAEDPRLFLAVGELLSVEALLFALKQQPLRPCVFSQLLRADIREKGPALRQLIDRLSARQQIKLLQNYFKLLGWEVEARDPETAEALCKGIASFPLEIRSQVFHNIRFWKDITPLRITMIRVTLAMLKGQATEIKLESLGTLLHDLIGHKDELAVRLLTEGLDAPTLGKMLCQRLNNSTAYFRAVQWGQVAVVKGFSEAMASLSPEDRLSFSNPNECGGLINQIAKNGSTAMLNTVCEQLTEDELTQSMKADVHGFNPVAHALLSRSAGMMDAILNVADRLGPQVRASALKRNDKQDTPLHHPSTPRAEGNMIQLISRLSPAELEDMVAPNSKGKSFLLNLIKCHQPTALSLLLKKIDSSQKPRLLALDREGRSVLHHTALQDNLTLLLQILDWLDPADLAPLARGDREGNTPLHLAVSGSEQLLKCYLRLRQRFDKETQAQWIAPNGSGDSLLALAAQSGQPENIKTIGNLLKKQGVLSEAFRSNHRGTTAFHYATKAARGKHGECIVALLEFATREQAIQSLRADDTGHTPLHDYYYPAVELLEYLPDHYAVAEALGRCPTVEACQGPLSEFLARHYPEKMDLLRLFLTGMVIRNHLLPLDTTYFADLAEHPIFSVLKSTCHFQVSGGVFCAFAPYLERLERRIHKHRGTDRARDLRNREQGLVHWQRILFATFIASDIAPARTLELTSIWQRMMRISDARVRQELTKLLLHYPPSSFTDRFLERAEKGSHALLALLPLDALFQRGVDQTLLHTAAEWILSEGRSLYTASLRGRVLLAALTALAHCRDLDRDDINDLLNRALQGNFYESCVAIHQILRLGQVHLLSRTDLKSAGQDLRHLSQRCFIELLDIADLERFPELYQHYIGTQRDPDSVISYLSLHRGFSDVKRDFAKYLTWVLKGEFYENRYAANNSKHLAKLYELQPTLQQRLPGLSTAMGRTPIGKENTRSTRFPMGKTELYDKIIEDGDLDHKGFPFIVKYLTAKTQKEARKIQVQLGMANKESPDKTLQLQILLIKLCHEKADPKTLEMRLREANKIATELGVFKSHLCNAIDTLERSRTTPSTPFEALVTDHYWDLFHIGTDIVGSCQSIYGGAMNRCLMGYVLDGRTFAVAVKKTGEERIVARRILRIEIDSSSQTPALFVERFYGNYNSTDIDEALIQKAKEVADYLNCPLYGTTGSPTTTTLQSLGCAAHWTYSDAGDGSSNGPYSIPNCCLVYTPAAAAVAASSSSS